MAFGSVTAAVDVVDVHCAYNVAAAFALYMALG